MDAWVVKSLAGDVEESWEKNEDFGAQVRAIVKEVRSMEKRRTRVERAWN
jgi:hypothetical protein